MYSSSKFLWKQSLISYKNLRW